MKKLLAGLFLALTALTSTQAFAWNQRAPGTVQQCAIHAPYGLPQTAGVYNQFAEKHI